MTLQSFRLAQLYTWRIHDSSVNFRRIAHRCRDRIPAITRRDHCRYNSSSPQHDNAVVCQRDQFRRSSPRNDPGTSSGSHGFHDRAHDGAHDGAHDWRDGLD
jgi:hypothetical protein